MEKEELVSDDGLIAKEFKPELYFSKLKDVLRVSVKNNFFELMFKGTDVQKEIKKNIPEDYTLFWIEKQKEAIDFLFIKTGTHPDKADLEDFNVFKND